MGIEPSATLRRLEQQILRQDAALDIERRRLLPPGDRARRFLPGSLVPTPPFPFVGRAKELAALHTLLERAAAGEGGVVLLTGKAGTGKTRLVRELAQEAAARDTLVLYGASDAAVSVPYQPLREWVKSLLAVCDPDALRECLEGRGDEISRVVPELVRLTGPPEPQLGSPATDRYALHGAVTEFLKRLSRLQPLLLVADDAHWADSETPQRSSVWLEWLRRRGCLSSSPSVRVASRSTPSSRMRSPISRVSMGLLGSRLPISTPTS